MQSYTIEFNGTGEVSDGQFRNDTEAQLWVELVLEGMGHDADEIVSGDWDADGENDEGNQCWRMLFWANEAAGSNAICQLCKVGK